MPVMEWLLFSPLAETSVRLANSRTIARPDFHHLAPFEHTNIQDTTVFDVDYRDDDVLGLVCDTPGGNGFVAVSAGEMNNLAIKVTEQ